jgi:hypothetical protein
MNYNNFASRISAPRVIRISNSSVPVPEPVKKPRKQTRRRLAAAAALLLLLPSLIQGARTHAADLSNSAPAFISSQALPDAGSLAKERLSPITAVLLGIGLAVAAIQGRLLFGRGELEC